MVYLFTCASIIFRCDVLVLLAPLDSYFWSYSLIPELSVLYYNTYLNKSSNWGTSPYLWYFYSAIPRSLFSSLFYIPLGIFPILVYILIKPKDTIKSLWDSSSPQSPKSTDKSSFSIIIRHIYKLIISFFHIDPYLQDIYIPIGIYILLYSILPHKELRFIFPILPALTCIAAVGLSRLWNQREKSSIPAILISLYTCASVLFTLFMVYISIYNYPGGMALQHLQSIAPLSSNVQPIYIDNYAAQTGVSRYLEDNERFTYDKNEHPTSLAAYKYILTNNVTDEFFETMNLPNISYIFNQICFSGLSKRGIQMRDCLYVLENKDFNSS
ncbi:hypothetical protein WA158_006681 [Blastocystis sp. Blastoise]